MSNKKLSIIIASFALLIYALLKEQIPLHNVSFYLSSCIVFLVVAVICYIFLEYVVLKKNANSNKSSFYQTVKGETVISCVSVCAFLIWMVFFFKLEPSVDHLGKNILLRERIPFFQWLLIMIGFMAIALVMIHFTGRTTSVLSKMNNTTRKITLKGALRFIVSILFTAYTCPIFYAPNLFLDVQGGTYHSTAYTNSIIMACWRTPYSWRMHDYYGHYAILYMPFLKVMRRLLDINFWTGTCIMIVVFSAISILGFLYVLNYFIKNDVIFYLSMFAIGNEFFIMMRGGEYYQVFPHRLLFPILLVAYAVWEKKHNKKASVPAYIFLIILMTLSTVWSIEVGSVGLIAFVAYRWIDHIYDGEFFSVKKALSLIKYGIIYFILPFGLAYLVVGLYNAWAGGDMFMDFKEYMYPLISDKGYLEYIELPLPGAEALWVGMTILFLSIICMTALPAIFSKEQPKPLYPLYFLMSVICVGNLTYYINRPVYSTVAINMYFAIIMVGIIFEKTQNYYLQWRKSRAAGQNGFSVDNSTVTNGVSDGEVTVETSSLKITPGKTVFNLSFRLVALFILSIMFVDSIYYLPQVYPAQRETVWKIDEFDEFAQSVYVQVPPMAYYVGEGVPELAAYLDRDPSVHCTEWSINNMTNEEEAALWNDITEQKPQWMFWNLASLAQAQENGPGFTDEYYRVNDLWEYGQAKFGFFIRKDE